MKVLVTGGAGFIGSNFVRYLLDDECQLDVEAVTILDALTYAGDPNNIPDDPRVETFYEDICNAENLSKIFVARPDVDVIVHFAAESHVDRSIHGASGFIQSNVVGTLNMLEEARKHDVSRFILISTDEVYGAAESGVSFTEDSPMNPRNPYSASKAGADRLGYAYFITHNLPIIIHRAANNYGYRQFPEKLVPLFCLKAMRGEPLPVYGDGRQIRDWLNVWDNCRAIETLILHGKPGEAYNVPAGNEMRNLNVVSLIKEVTKTSSKIEFVKDRPGHDIRYSLDGRKLEGLGWFPETEWEQGMTDTILWFMENHDWLEAAFERGQDFNQAWYANRGGDSS